jgi:hypothetical protein
VSALLAVAAGLCLAAPGCSGGSKVSKENADKINVGMSEKEVTDLLGSPAESAEVEVPDVGAALGGQVQMKKAKQSTWKDGNKVIAVTFLDSKVSAKVFTDGSGAARGHADPAKAPSDKPKDNPLDRPPFQQTGTFALVADQEGVVNFPIPYALPPNVELSGNLQASVVVKEIKATGFKWKAVGPLPQFSDKTITWTSKGVKATKIPEGEEK